MSSYTITWSERYYYYNNYNYNNYNTINYPGTLSLSAKYGASITQLWKTTFNGYNSSYNWNFTTNNNDKFYNIDTMPSGDKTVHAFGSSTTKQQTLRYWLENYDGSRTKSYNGRTYGLLKEITVTYNYLYDNADFYAIVGYDKAGYFGTNNYVLGNSTQDGLEVDFHYNAKSYPLSYYNTVGTLINSYSVKLNSDISGYMTSNIPAKPVGDAVWKGWYLEPAHATLYSGNNKMPAGWSAPSLCTNQ